MERDSRQIRLGVSAGMLAGVTWALDTVLMGVVLAMTPFVDNATAMFLAPFASTFLHDACSSIWAMIYVGVKGEFKNALRALKTRSGKFIVLGALLGGPVGMTGYLLAVKHIGPAYTASISSLFPAAGAFFAFVFLKEKLDLRGWTGLAISIAGTVVLGYSPDGTQGSSYLLGFVFALVCVFGWSMESVICAYGMKDDEVSPEQAIMIRQMTSAIFYAVAIIPVIKAYPLINTVLFTKTSALVLVTALAGTASYEFYYNAIHKIGPIRSTALNITYAVWAIVFQTLLFKMPVNPKLVLCCLAIMFGSILVVGNPKDMMKIN